MLKARVDPRVAHRLVGGAHDLRRINAFEFFLLKMPFGFYLGWFTFLLLLATAAIALNMRVSTHPSAWLFSPSTLFDLERAG